MVLVVLAIIWAAVLVPPALRARAEGRPGDSISAFRRQLSVLRRARPHSPSARAQEVSRSYGTYSPAPPTPIASLTARRAVATGRVTHQPHPIGAPMRRVPVRMSSARSRTLRRRRDVLGALCVLAAATLALGLLAALRVLLLAHLVIDVLLVAYVAMLVRQRTLAAEREIKVRFLPDSRSMEPALLRRSVN